MSLLLKTFSTGLQKALKSTDGLQLASHSVLLEFLKLLGITYHFYRAKIQSHFLVSTFLKN